MRPRTTTALAATALLGGSAAGAVLAGRYAGRAALGPEALPAPAGFRHRYLTVHESVPGCVTLSRTPDAVTPGRYAVTGRDGELHAELGEVLETDGPTATVTRRIARVTGRLPAPGGRLLLTPQLHRGDPRSVHGMGFTSVRIPGELGSLPAWFVPGDRELWVIALHGLGTTREHPLNLLPFLHAAGFPVLLPAYRGDPGAPEPRGGIGRLGAAEWHDADAALRHAVRFGARRVLLYGWSTGATMALHAAVHSPLRDRVHGLVLDSPVLDRPATLGALASERGVPARALSLATGGVRDSAGPAPHGAPQVPVRVGGLPMPMLLFHGPQDTIAPWQASQDLAARHEESVLLHTVHHAEHAASWNADPDAYERALRDFLTPLA